MTAGYPYPVSGQRVPVSVRLIAPISPKHRTVNSVSALKIRSRDNPGKSKPPAGGFFAASAGFAGVFEPPESSHGENARKPGINTGGLSILIKLFVRRTGRFLRNFAENRLSTSAGSVMV